MSPTPKLHVCITALILLLVAFSNVHSVFMKTVSRSSTQDELNTQKHQVEEESHHNSTQRHHQAGSDFKTVPDKSLFYDNEPNVSHSVLEASVAEANFVSQREHLSNSSSSVSVTNIISASRTENVIKSTLGLSVTNVTSSQTENVINFTSEMPVTNITFTSQTDNVINSTSEVPFTNITFASQTENVINSASEVPFTNITFALQTESVSNTTLYVSDKNHVITLEGENVSNMEEDLSSEADDNHTIDQNINNSSFNFRKYNTNSSITKENHDFELNNSTSSELLAENVPMLEEELHNSWSNDSISNHSSSETNSSDHDPLVESGCVTCRKRAIDRHYRILQFKNQILNSLHITNLPNTTGVPIPKVPAMMHLYEMNANLMSDSTHGKRNGYRRQDDESDDDFLVKTERVFISAKEAPLALHLNLTDTVYFPPAVQLFTADIASAYLWFYIRKNDVPPPYVTVERILPQSKPGQTFVTKKLFSLKLAKGKAFGWKRMNLKDTLRQWIRHPMTNFGLQLKAEGKPGNNLIVLPPSPDVDKGYEPWLDTKIVEARHSSRRRRSESLMCAENATDSRCCKHPLLVGFAEFGWEWIIAPTHVDADYCIGECRLTMQDSTPYSWVNQQVTGTNSCCTPTKLLPLPLLYFDESMNVVYQILQNMKVDKCGCA